MNKYNVWCITQKVGLKQLIQTKKTTWVMLCFPNVCPVWPQSFLTSYWTNIIEWASQTALHQCALCLKSVFILHDKHTVMHLLRDVWLLNRTNFLVLCHTHTPSYRVWYGDGFITTVLSTCYFCFFSIMCYYGYIRFPLQGRREMMEVNNPNPLLTCWINYFTECS